VIEFRDVSKSFWNGKFRTVILAGASFQVPLGKGLGILARNGTGKSTLINMMAGIERPDEGEIIRAARVSFPVGMRPGVVGALSGAANVRYVARIYGADPDMAEAWAADFSELGPHFFLPVRTYSSGMRARLGIALLLALDFDVYLIDEAFSVGDGAFGEKAALFLRDRLSRATVVMVSHNLRQLRSFCESAAVLDQGRLTLFDRFDDAEAAYHAQAA
jgi:capsular polysaccharide transport system ATP-binding protein